jgi:hypothetical protein
MRLLRGIVIDTQTPFISIRMETGFVFWTVSKPHMSIRSRVFVAWDFTHDRPADVMLKPEGEVDPISEVDIFSITDNDNDDISKTGVIDISLVDIFSITVDDEDDIIGISLSSQHNVM